jgi:Fe2+ or Zn2+ uptake regulation protein
MNIPETMKFLRAAGKRITPERKLLLRIISENAHLDASEIYQLAKREDSKISLSTVYRTVRLLEELGLVEARELGEDHYHYEVRLEDHYHLICLDCGKVVEIPPVDAVRKLGAERGFEIVEVKLELLGYCPACQKKRARKKKGSPSQVPTERPQLPGPIARMIDLRKVSLIAHPERVSRALEQLKINDLLEILSYSKNRIEVASKMLATIPNAELVAMWTDGLSCHAVLRKQSRL